MKKTILVTGGAGFIGSNLIEGLLRKYTEAKIISLDNYFTGKKENHLEGPEYREGDTGDIEKYISETPDIVFHLGEYPRAEKSFDDIELVWRFNLEGTFRVLEFCRKKKCRLVYAGSSTKFAIGEVGKNMSPYAWAKATNTELINNYGGWFNLNYTITYFYNVYGPREIEEGEYATFIALLLRQAKEGKPLTVVSPGTQKRNFTHVSDIVDGLMLVGESGKGDGYALGCRDSYTVMEIAEMIGSNTKMLPERAGNRMDSTLDTSKAEKELGWSAKRKITDYIDEQKKIFQIGN